MAFIALTGVAPEIVGAVTGAEPNVVVLMAAIAVIYLVLGMFLDPIGIMVLTLPLMVPLVESYGLDLIWFGVVVIKLLEIGLITPPVGLNVFVISSVVGRDVPIDRIFAGLLRFLSVDRAGAGHHHGRARAQPPDPGHDAMNDMTETDRRFATTLARGLSVLRAFRPSDDGLGNAEIAERTGLPKSTVSRLTYTLHALGYLTHARHGERYRPGPALLALGNVAAASISFVELAGPIMQRLADETRTLSLLAVRDRGRLVLTKAWRPAGVSSIWLEVGHRLPLSGSSSGHCFLAALSEEGLAQVLEEADGDRGLSEGRAVEIRREAYGQLIARGFAITDPSEYFSSNIHAVATPYFPRDLSEPVVFSCGATPADLSLERMEREVGPKLRAAVRDLETALGQPPAPLRR